ncbi:MAG: hypothetical protein NC218_01330 [Acetobacter sp.]|nr:hypothetical protein [Acetobacter sp.]
MEIIETAEVNNYYAVLVLTPQNFITCEFYQEYPDVLARTYTALDVNEMRKKGIEGFAFCVYEKPVWVEDKLRAITANGRQALLDYIRKQLNASYQKVIFDSKPKGD